MSFTVENYDDYVDFNLDEFLSNDENRTPNKFGLYRVNCLVIGKTGSGKTTWLIKQLLSGNIDDFIKIICIIPRESYESGIYEKIRTNKDLSKFFVFYIIGEESLPTVNEISSLNLKGKIAIILDDFINSFSKYDWLILKRYITQLSRVKFGCSLFVLTQYLQLLPVSYRKNFNMFVMFVNSFSKLQFNDIMRSYYDTQIFDKKQLDELYNTTKQSAHVPLIAINNSDYNRSLLYGNKWIISTND